MSAPIVDFDDSGSDFRLEDPPPPPSLDPATEYGFKMQAWSTQQIVGKLGANAKQTSRERAKVIEVLDKVERSNQSRHDAVMGKLSAPGPVGRLANAVADDALVRRTLIGVVVGALLAGGSYIGIKASTAATQPTAIAGPAGG